MSRTAVPLTLDTCEQALLQHIHRKRSIAEYQKERIQIVLAAATGLQNKDIAAQYGFERHRVGKWRKRWAKQHQDWQQSDCKLRPAMNESLVLLWLDDQKGRGRKMRITVEQRAKVAGLSLETPEQKGLPVTHWTLKYLVEMSKKHGIVDTISRSTVHRILKKTTCRPIGVGTG
jgi:putative transposase